ncbi:MAG TPA: hypothetical protein VJB98_03860 [Candidatus Paceibacterota bacterium]
MEEKKIASALLALLAFVLPIAELPFGASVITADKKLIFAIGSILLILVWSVARIIDGSFVVPRSSLLYAGFAVGLAYLAGAIFSLDRATSFSGNLFDNETFWVIALLLALMYISSLAFQNLHRAALFYLALLASGALLFVNEVLRASFGWNLGALGKLYDVGIFFGLILLLALIFLEFAPKTAFLRRASLVMFVISLFALLVINFTLVWWVIGVCSLVLISRTLYSRKCNSLPPTVPYFPVIVVVVSISAIIFGYLGGPIERVTSTIAPHPFEVRPSPSMTWDVALSSLATNLAFGIGPNLFVQEWHMSKPDSVNTGDYFGADFNVGFSHLLTAPVTVGLFGFLASLSLICALGLYLFKALRQSLTDSPQVAYVLASLFGAVYMLVFSVLYIPDLVILATTFILIGISVALGVLGGGIRELVVSSKIFPHVRTSVVLALVVLALGSLSLSYLYIQKYRAFASFEAGLFEKAAAIDNFDAYYRSLSLDYVSKFTEVLSRPIPGSESEVGALREEFANYFDQASINARAAIEVGPHNYLNYVLLGNLYETATALNIDGAYEYAGENYRRAIELNPTNPALLLDQARLEIVRNNPEGAVEPLAAAIRMKPNYIPAYILEAEVAFQAGDYVAALEKLELVSSFAPDDPNVIAALSNLKAGNAPYSR